MFKVGEKLVYKRNVCVVKEIKENHYAGNDYYILMPIDDDSLKIEIPCENKLGNIRDVITVERAHEIIDKMPSIKILDVADRLLEPTYKELLASGVIEDLVVIIKTTYLRNAQRLEANKKTTEKDDKYLAMAERFLYNELSVALNLSVDEVKEYIKEKISNEKSS